MAQPQILEGTWEELAMHSDEFQGRKLRLIVLTEDQATSPSLEESEELLDELAALGNGAPAFPDETYSRERLYLDHD